MTTEEEAVREGGDYKIRAAERVCDVLDVLQASEAGVPLPIVAEATGLPKSSAFRYLVTLEARKYAERDPATGRFRVGKAFLPFLLRQSEIVAQRARPRLEQVRDKFQETVNLGLLDGSRVAYLDILESPRAVRLAARRGDRDWVHSTALGKAIAAYLPEDSVREILAHDGMPRLTGRTITSIAAYMGELQQVRERGYALDDRENESDGRCVAVPVHLARLPLALSISAPVTRLELEATDKVARDLMAVATDLASDLDELLNS